MSLLNEGDGARTRNLRIDSPVLYFTTADSVTSYDEQSACTSSNTSNSTQNLPPDADLQAVIDAWPTLPAAVKAGILAMVESVGE